MYRDASSADQNRVQIAFTRLISPDTSSMDLPQMPGGDAAGFSGVTGEVDKHYLATFGTAAMMALISAGQAVGQIDAFGSSSYGYAQPNQYAIAGQSAGAGASGEFGGVGMQMVNRGTNRPPTITVQPGYEFNVIISEDLVFSGAYKG